MSTDVLLDIAVRTLITHSYSQRIKKVDICSLSTGLGRTMQRF